MWGRTERARLENQALDEIEPRAVIGSESELEVVRGLAGEPVSGLFGDSEGGMDARFGRQIRGGGRDRQQAGSAVASSNRPSSAK
jgi:hypothetical protein